MLEQSYGSRLTQHPTITCAAILRLLRTEGYDLPAPDSDYRIVRSRAGHWQRSEGAWSWWLEWRGQGDRPYQCTDMPGSKWPARECAKPGAFVVGNTIYPASEKAVYHA
jgi:hypothetical protein